LSVTFLISSLNPGGAERVVSLLANQISKKKDVIVITLSRDTPFYKLNDSIKIIQLGSSQTTSTFGAIYSNLILILKLLRLLKKLKTKHLICFMTTSNVLGVISGKLLTNIKVTISERRNPLTHDVGFWDNLRKKVYNFADRLVVQSEEIKNYYNDFIDETKIKIVPNPIKIYGSIKAKKENIILTVGRIDSNKNQQQIIRSFFRLNKEGWKLIICGDGPLLDELIELSKKLGISDQIEFTGVVKNIDDYYKRASIFAFSSLSEGFPNVLLEAMNYGCACISTDCPTGPSLLIKNNFNGFLIPLADKSSYTNHFQKLIDDEKTRNFFVGNSIKSLENYSLNKVAEQWVN
jgi:GalNAc-alpha-(1->4)-GalNAc-alpha-(1->3)-diNAcBac-PP-undecaprenol alpha-1,4-N-acetyl-D-galactosaminyltransferase